MGHPVPQGFVGSNPTPSTISIQNQFYEGQYNNNRTTAQQLLVNKLRYAGDGKKVDCFFSEIPYGKITPDKYPVLNFSITP